MQNLRDKGFTLIEVLSAMSIILALLTTAIYCYSVYKTKAFDTVAKEDLRQAYSMAIGYFVDHPEGKVTMSALDKYGFKASANVNIRVINGRLPNLLLISSYNLPDSHTYMSFYQGTNRPGIYDQIWLEPIQSWGSGPNPNDPQQYIRPAEAKFWEMCNQATQMDLREAYNAAQDYFRTNPGGMVTKEVLFNYGYVPNESINLVIVGGTYSNFSMSAILNIPGATNYTIDSSGNIING